MGSNFISTIVINNASALYGLALGNFGDLRTLSGAPYLPFDPGEGKVGVNRTDTCVLLDTRRGSSSSQSRYSVEH